MSKSVWDALDEIDLDDDEKDGEGEAKIVEKLPKGVYEAKIVECKTITHKKTGDEILLIRFETETDHPGYAEKFFGTHIKEVTALKIFATTILKVDPKVLRNEKVQKKLKGKWFKINVWYRQGKTREFMNVDIMRRIKAPVQDVSEDDL